MAEIKGSHQSEGLNQNPQTSVPQTDTDDRFLTIQRDPQSPTYLQALKRLAADPDQYRTLNEELFRLGPKSLATIRKAMESDKSSSAKMLLNLVGWQEKKIAHKIRDKAKGILKLRAQPGSEKPGSAYRKALAEVLKDKDDKFNKVLQHLSRHFLSKRESELWEKQVQEDFTKTNRQMGIEYFLDLDRKADALEDEGKQKQAEAIRTQYHRELAKKSKYDRSKMQSILRANNANTARAADLLGHLEFYELSFPKNIRLFQKTLAGIAKKSGIAKLHFARILDGVYESHWPLYRYHLTEKEKVLWDALIADEKLISQSLRLPKDAKFTDKAALEFFLGLSRQKTPADKQRYLADTLAVLSPAGRKKIREQGLLYLNKDPRTKGKARDFTKYSFDSFKRLRNAKYQFERYLDDELYQIPNYLSHARYYDWTDWFDFYSRNPGNELESLTKKLALKIRHPQEFENALVQLGRDSPQKALDLSTYLTLVRNQLNLGRFDKLPAEENWDRILTEMNSELFQNVHLGVRVPNKIEQSDAHKWRKHRSWKDEYQFPDPEKEKYKHHVISFIDDIATAEIHALDMARVYPKRNSDADKLIGLTLKDKKLTAIQKEMKHAYDTLNRWDYEEARVRYLARKWEVISDLRRHFYDPRDWDPLKPKDISIEGWSKWHNDLVDYIEYLDENSNPPTYPEIDPIYKITSEIGALEAVDDFKERQRLSLYVHFHNLLLGCNSALQGAIYKEILKKDEKGEFAEKSQYPTKNHPHYCYFLRKYFKDVPTLATDANVWQSFKPGPVDARNWEIFRIQMSEMMYDKNTKRLKLTADFIDPFTNFPEKILKKCEDENCRDLQRKLVPKIGEKPVWKWRALEKLMESSYGRYQELEKEAQEREKKIESLQKELAKLNTILFERRLAGMSAHKPVVKKRRWGKKREEFDSEAVDEFFWDLKNNINTGNRNKDKYAAAMLYSATGRYRKNQAFYDGKKVTNLPAATLSKAGFQTKASETLIVGQQLGYPKVLTDHFVTSWDGKILGKEIWKGPINIYSLHDLDANKLEEVRQWVLDKVEVVEKESKTANKKAKENEKEEDKEKQLRLSEALRKQVPDKYEQERLLRGLGALLSLVNHELISKATEREIVGISQSRKLRKFLTTGQDGGLNQYDHVVKVMLSEKLALDKHAEEFKQIQKLVSKYFKRDKFYRRDGLPGFSWVGLSSLIDTAKKERKEYPKQLPNIYFNWLIRLGQFLDKHPGGSEIFAQLLLAPSSDKIMELAQKYDRELFNLLDKQGKLPRKYRTNRSRIRLMREENERVLKEQLKKVASESTKETTKTPKNPTGQIQKVDSSQWAKKDLSGLEVVKNPNFEEQSALDSLRGIQTTTQYNDTFQNALSYLKHLSLSDQEHFGDYLQANQMQVAFALGMGGTGAVSAKPQEVLRDLMHKINIRQSLIERHRRDPDWKKKSKYAKVRQLDREMNEELSNTQLRKTLDKVFEQNMAIQIAVFREQAAKELLREAIDAEMKRPFDDRWGSVVDSEHPLDTSELIRNGEEEEKIKEENWDKSLALYRKLYRLLKPGLEARWMKDGKKFKSEKEKNSEIKMAIERLRMQLIIVEPAVTQSIAKWEKQYGKSIVDKILTGTKKMAQLEGMLDERVKERDEMLRDLMKLNSDGISGFRNERRGIENGKRLELKKEPKEIQDAIKRAAKKREPTSFGELAARGQLSFSNTEDGVIKRIPLDLIAADSLIDLGKRRKLHDNYSKMVRDETISQANHDIGEIRQQIHVEMDRQQAEILEKLSKSYLGTLQDNDSLGIAIDRIEDWDSESVNNRLGSKIEKAHLTNLEDEEKKVLENAAKRLRQKGGKPSELYARLKAEERAKLIQAVQRIYGACKDPGSSKKGGKVVASARRGVASISPVQSTPSKVASKLVSSGKGGGVDGVGKGRKPCDLALLVLKDLVRISFLHEEKGLVESLLAKYPFSDDEDEERPTSRQIYSELSKDQKEQLKKTVKRLYGVDESCHFPGRSKGPAPKAASAKSSVNQKIRGVSSRTGKVAQGSWNSRAKAPDLIGHGRGKAICPVTMRFLADYIAYPLRDEIYRFTPKGEFYLTQMFMDSMNEHLGQQNRFRSLADAARIPEKEATAWNGKTTGDALLDAIYQEELENAKVGQAALDHNDEPLNYQRFNLAMQDREALRRIDEKREKRDRIHQALKKLKIGCLYIQDLGKSECYQDAELWRLERFGPPRKNDSPLSNSAKDLRKELGPEALAAIQKFVLNQYDQLVQPYYKFELNDETTIGVVWDHKKGANHGGVTETVYLTQTAEERKIARLAREELSGLEVQLKEATGDLGGTGNGVANFLKDPKSPEPTSYEKKHNGLSAQHRTAKRKLELRKGVKQTGSDGKVLKHDKEDRAKLVAEWLPDVNANKNVLDQMARLQPERMVGNFESLAWSIGLTVASFVIPGSGFVIKGLSTAKNLTRTARVLRFLQVAGARTVNGVVKLRNTFVGGAKMGFGFAFANHAVSAGITAIHHDVNDSYVWYPGSSRVDKNGKVRPGQGKLPKYLDWNQDGVLDHKQGGTRISFWNGEWALPEFNTFWNQGVSSTMTFGLAGKIAPYIRVAEKWQMAAASGLTATGQSVVGTGYESLTGDLPKTKEGQQKVTRMEHFKNKMTDWRTYAKGVGEGVKTFVLVSPLDDLVAWRVMGNVTKESVSTLKWYGVKAGAYGGAFAVNNEMSGWYAYLDHTVFNPEQGYRSILDPTDKAESGWDAYWMGKKDGVGGDLIAPRFSIKQVRKDKIRRDLKNGRSLEEIRKDPEYSQRGLVDEVVNTTMLHHLKDPITRACKECEDIEKRKKTLNITEDPKRDLSSAEKLIDEIAQQAGITHPDDVARFRAYAMNRIISGKRPRTYVRELIPDFLAKNKFTAFSKIQEGWEGDPHSNRYNPEVVRNMASQPKLAEELDLKVIDIEPPPPAPPQPNGRQQKKTLKPVDHKEILIAAARARGLPVDDVNFREYFYAAFRKAKANNKANGKKAKLKDFFDEFAFDHVASKSKARKNKIAKYQKPSAQDTAIILQIAKSLGIDINNHEVRKHLIDEFKRDANQPSYQGKGPAELTLSQWMQQYKRLYLGPHAMDAENYELKWYGAHKSPQTDVNLYAAAKKAGLPVHIDSVWKRFYKAINNRSTRAKHPNHTVADFIREFEKQNYHLWMRMDMIRVKDHVNAKETLLFASAELLGIPVKDASGKVNQRVWNALLKDYKRAKKNRATGRLTLEQYLMNYSMRNAQWLARQ